jgi:hypothetical protein
VRNEVVCTRSSNTCLFTGNSRLSLKWVGNPLSGWWSIKKVCGFNDPAMRVVPETMMAWVLAAEALRKFGGDSMAEVLRNRDRYLASLRR